MEAAGTAHSGTAPALSRLFPGSRGLAWWRCGFHRGLRKPNRLQDGAEERFPRKKAPLEAQPGTSSSHGLSRQGRSRAVGPRSRQGLGQTGRRSAAGPSATLGDARSQTTHHGRSREAPVPARSDRGSSARVARRAAGGRRRAAGPASPPQGRLGSGTQLLSARRGSGPAMV